MARDLTIPQRLEWLLKKRGVSQNALARVAKVSPQTVANTLRHGRVPQSKTTLKWARTLGVPGSVFSAKKMTDDQLLKIVAAQGSWRFSEGTSATKKPVAKKKVAARKPAARKVAKKKVAVRKPVAKKAMAKKTTTKKVAARKPLKKAVAKKKVAVRKPATARKTTAKKTIARKPAARKIAKKTIARKPAARKVAKKTAVRTIVRHGGTAAKRSTGSTRTTARKTAARKSTASRTPVRAGLAARSNGKVNSINFDTIVSKLQKLANSRSEQVALDACKTLLTLR